MYSTRYTLCCYLFSEAQLISIAGEYATHLCAETCDAYAEESEIHFYLEHCKQNAVTCRNCSEECRKMAA